MKHSNTAAPASRLRTTGRRASAELHLTSRERRILADPDWVTEDEADVIYSLRNRKQPTVPLEEVARELGYTGMHWAGAARGPIQDPG